MDSKSSEVYDINEDSPLMSNIFSLLKLGEHENALKELKNKKHYNYLKHNSLEAVPILSKILQEEFCNAKTEECIEDMLSYIASIANPKESMLVFLEEIEIFRSTNQFRVMLKPLQTLLLTKVSPSANSSSFTWVFNSLNALISALPLPSNKNLEGEEKKLLDSDPDLRNIVDVLVHMLDFYNPFYTKILAKELIWTGKDVDSKEYFSYFLLQLFHKPLAELHISNLEDKNHSSLFPVCSKLVHMVTSLINNPFKLLPFIKHKTVKQNIDVAPSEQTDNELTEEEKPDCISQLSLAVYFYCILGEGMCSSSLPCVYANEFIYMSLFPSCIYLLEEKENTCTVYKGLVLFNGLLRNLDNDSLPENSLDMPNCLQLLNTLIQIMIYCDNKECRTMALSSLKEWLWNFKSDERVRVITIILSTNKHSGVLGCIIHEVKENIRKNLCESVPVENCFRGTKLQDILTLACHLQDGEKTDILEWSDKIMGALNLLIFICLRDPQDSIDYKSVLPKLSREFLTPLENGLRISKAHYELKLKDLNEGGNSLPQPEVNVNVGGSSYTGIPLHQEKQMVVEALNWFDTMQCVWARTNKIVSETILQ